MKAILVTESKGSFELNIMDKEGFIDSLILSRVTEKYDVVQIPFRFGLVPIKLSTIIYVHFYEDPELDFPSPLTTIEEAEKIYAGK